MKSGWKATVMFCGIMLLLGVFALLEGCKPAKPKKEKPKMGKVVSVAPQTPRPFTPEQSPEPTAVPEPTATVPPDPLVPEVKHVAAKAQPTPKMEDVVKGAVQRMPSVQRTQWETAKIKPVWEISVNKAVMLYLRTKDRYEVVERMRSDGVPAPVLFALHYRESSNSFSAHPHEGSSLLHRTRYIPKNRPPPPAQPPFSWEFSAEDAYYACDKNLCDKMQGDWANLAWAFTKIENFNGPGYRKKGIPSPYLWSGTTNYSSGKYVADGRYSSSAVDKQLGVLAILKRMKEKGIEIAFDR